MKVEHAINISLAAFPGMRHEEAALMAIGMVQEHSLHEPALGLIQAQHVQLVPQNFGMLDEDLADGLMLAFPEVQFRLHANVRVTPKHEIAELSGFLDHKGWFDQAAKISRRFKAPAYTAHSGSRHQATLSVMLDNVRRLQELFDCPVGVEGQYPTPKNDLLVSSWDEYREVLESGVFFALDLSHLNILAHQSGIWEAGLTKEMLSSPQCIEVHVSDNDGRGDWHQVCEKQCWWHELLPHIHPKAVVFSEGNHRCKRKSSK